MARSIPLSHKPVNGKYDCQAVGRCASSAHYAAMRLRVKEIRKLRRMSQQDLGDAIGLTQAHISRIERGDRLTTINRLEEIADALNCRVVDLIDDGLDSDLRQLVAVMAQLTPEDRRTLARLADSLRTSSAEEPQQG